MPGVIFTHHNIGTLTIDNGIDDASWAYNLNTAVFPTYGGEVIQILSVYIEDLTLMGTVATYAQVENIYKFFAHYMQIASQGNSPVPGSVTSVNQSAYNLLPIVFSYPHRGWSFQLYPLAAPAFRYGLDVVTPQWQIRCHVVDSSPDLNLIHDGIAAAALNFNKGGPLQKSGSFTLSGDIADFTLHPSWDNPEADPFQTFDQGTTQQGQVINKYSTYYNNLLSKYTNDDFSSITAGMGSQPASTSTTTQKSTSTSTTTGTPSSSHASAHSGNRKHP